MEANTTMEKVVTLNSLEEAVRLGLIATTEEVDEKIAKAVADCANIVYATTEEVLALFKRTPPETTGGGDTPGGEA